MTKVYFACSIRAGRDDQPIYAQLVEIIKKSGAEVLSELFGDKHLMDSSHQALTESEIWKKDLDMVRMADAVIAEVTNPSLGVGYEIAKAEEWDTPVLALYRATPERKLSAMIKGSPSVLLVEYQDPDKTSVAIKKFLESLN